MPDTRLSSADRSGLLMPPLAVLVTGGTGFIGRRLVALLARGGHKVTVLTRDPGKAARLWPGDGVDFITRLDQIDANYRLGAIVNLAGEPISDGLWTAGKRQRIIASRLAVTRQVVELIARLAEKPVLVSGSAIGWYGVDSGDAVLDERSEGTACFSRQVCLAWEAEAMKAQALGARVVLLRTGLVLAPEGGMLQRLLLPFRLGLGGPMGDGRHWMSWIHRDDLVGLILCAMADPAWMGPINGTAPEPVTNRAFAKALAGALHRPAWLAVPAWPLKMLLGDMARELLLAGPRVVPQAALAAGFAFRYPDLDTALADFFPRAVA